MHEAFDTRFEFHECAVRNEVDHFAFDLGSNSVLGFDLFPWVLQLLLEAEADPFFFAVDIENNHVDILTNLEDFRWVPNTAPAHVGDVQQTIDTIEVDE